MTEQRAQTVAIYLVATLLSLASQADDTVAGCEALLERADQGLRAGHCLFVAGSTGTGRAALDELERLYSAKPEELWLGLYRGALAQDLGHPDAETYLLAASAAFAAAGEFRGVGHCHINLSRLRRSRGNRYGALADLQRAANAAALAGNDELVAEVKVQEARLLVGHDGDLARARRLLDEAEETAIGSHSWTLRRDLLLALGEVEFSLGRYPAARRAYRRMAEAAAREIKPRAEAAALLHLALVQLAERQLPADRPVVAAALGQAIEKAQQADHPQIEATARQSLGRLLGPDGGEQLELAMEIAQRDDEPHLQASIYGALASYWLDRDPQRSAQLIDQAMEIAKTSDQPRVATYLWSDRLMVRWETRPRQSAIADALQLLELLEASSSRQNETFSRANYLAVWTDAYRWVASKLLDGDPGERDIELAFQVIERMRARVLRQALARQRPAAHPREEGLLRQQVAINRRLLAALESDQRSSALAELDGIERQLAEVRQTVDKASLQSRAPLAELSAVEASLRPDEALLSFQIGLWEDIFGHQAGGAWLVVTSQAGRQVHRLPDRATLEPSIALFRGLFERRSGGERHAAAKLYADLLASALAELPPAVDRLVIVPDGILHLLPFDALRASPEAPPLVERYALSVVPSASLWHQWRLRPGRPAAGSALVLADPELTSMGTEAEASTRSAVFAGGLNLGALPWARREGQAVVRHLGGQLHSGEAASESRFKAQAAEHSVLHLAAHAVVDGERSWRSAVLLAAGADDQDGLLQPHEIHRLDLSNQLVVLSACQTGAGTVLQGEGPMSLARAFFQAGAKSVVASLWPLRDDEAALLMERFATHLATGADVATALARAKRDRLEAGAPSAAWAGVVALGDGATTPFPGGRPSIPWPWIAVGLAGLLVLSWWFSRRQG